MSIKIIARNKRASYDFQLLEKVEAGIVLQGTEVKSLREGKASLAEAFVLIDQNFEAYILNLTIEQYSFGNRNNHPQSRRRKLLLHKRQIRQIHQKMKTQGLSLIPLQIHFSNSLVKLDLALAKGKKLYDKRASAREKEDRRTVRENSL